MATLTSLLVERQLVPVRAVEDAIARQVIYGGDLATNLLETGAISEEALLPVAAEAAGLDALPVGKLRITDVAISRLLPGELALRHGICPVEIHDAGGHRELTIATSEPLASGVEEDLAFLLNMALRPMYATRGRILQALADHFGQPLDRRFGRLVARLEGRSDVGPATTPPPPIAPAIQPISDEASARPGAPSGIEPSSPYPVVRSLKPTLRGIVLPDGWQLAPTSNPAAALPETIELTPQPAPASAAVKPMPIIGIGQGEPREDATEGNIPVPLVQKPALASLAKSAKPRVRAPRRKGPFPLADAEKALDAATGTDGALEVFFDFAQQFFEYSALFVVHGDLAEGRDASGRGADAARVQAIGLPLDLPSMLATARERGVPIVIEPEAGSVDEELLRDLGRAGSGPTAPSAAAAIVVVPVIVRTRVVALLYGDDAPTPVEMQHIGAVITFAARTGTTIERLILRRKLGHIAEAVVAPKPAPKPPPPKRAPAGGGMAALAKMFSSRPRPETAALSAPGSVPASSGDIGHGLADEIRQHLEAESDLHGAGALFGEQRKSPEIQANFETPATEELAAEPEGDADLNAQQTPPPEIPIAGPEVAIESAPPPSSGPLVSALPSTAPYDRVDTVRFDEDSVPPEAVIITEESIIPEADSSIETRALPLAPGPIAAIVDEPTQEAERDLVPFVTATPVTVLPQTPSPAIEGARAETPSDEAATRVAAQRFIAERALVVDVSADSTEGLEGAIARAAEVAEPATWISPDAPTALPFATPPAVASLGGVPLDAIVSRAATGDMDAQQELRDRANQNLAPIVAMFPGPLLSDRHRAPDRLPPASECGPVLDAIAKTGARAAPMLAVLARHEDPDTRFWAAHSLGDIHDPAIVDALLPFLLDVDASVRRIALRSAATAIRITTPERPLEIALVRVSRDAGAALRERVSAIEAMGQLRVPPIVPSLISLLGMEPPEVAEAARRALLVVTRQDFGRDGPRWNDWWSSNHHRHRIEWLIDALMHDTQSIRRAAGDELKQLTKEYFGYYDDLPKRERERAQERYRQWWEREGREKMRA